MAEMEKITITLAREQLEDIRALVEGGSASSVSAFVQHAVKVALSDAAGWQEMLQEALNQTGGPLTKAERDRIDSLLAGGTRKRKSRMPKAA